MIGPAPAGFAHPAPFTDPPAPAFCAAFRAATPCWYFRAVESEVACSASSRACSSTCAACSFCTCALAAALACTAAEKARRAFSLRPTSSSFTCCICAWVAAAAFFAAAASSAIALFDSVSFERLPSRLRKSVALASVPDSSSVVWRSAPPLRESCAASWPARCFASAARFSSALTCFSMVCSRSLAESTRACAVWYSVPRCSAIRCAASAAACDFARSALRLAISFAFSFTFARALSTSLQLGYPSAWADSGIATRPAAPATAPRVSRALRLTGRRARDGSTTGTSLEHCTASGSLGRIRRLAARPRFPGQSRRVARAPRAFRLPPRIAYAFPSVSPATGDSGPIV